MNNEKEKQVTHNQTRETIFFFVMLLLLYSFFFVAYISNVVLDVRLRRRFLARCV